MPPEEATTGEGNPFEKKVLGSCHCEMVQFYVTRDKPLKAKFCHCSDCQIIHGKVISNGPIEAQDNPLLGFEQSRLMG